MVKKKANAVKICIMIDKTHCHICKKLLRAYSEEPLNPYLAELGFKKTGKRFCGRCFYLLMLHYDLI